MVKTRITAMVFALLLMSQSVLAASFNDIKGHWAETTIVTIADKGIVNGVTNTQFMPDGEVTRAQYLKMIMEATGLKTAPVRRGECLDANNGQWYGPYLQSALDAGLIPEPMVAGYKEEVKYELDENGNAISSKVIYSGAFNGELPITREEMAILIANFIAVAGNYADMDSYMDATGNIYLKNSFSDCVGRDEAIDQLYALEIIGGRDGVIFEPDALVSRQEAAAFMTRVADKFMYITTVYSKMHADSTKIAPWAWAYVSWALDKGILSVDDDDKLYPERPMTVQQAITALSRLYDIVTYWVD